MCVLSSHNSNGCHYSDVIMSAMGSKTLSYPLCVQPFFHTQIKENIKAPRHWSLWGESTGDRWIPLTSNQIVWTPFHSMYENSTLCTNWFVHQANTAGAFIVHQGNVTGAFIVHQGNVAEHFGSYIKAERSSPTVVTGKIFSFGDVIMWRHIQAQSSLNPVGRKDLWSQSGACEYILHLYKQCAPDISLSIFSK